MSRLTMMTTSESQKVVEELLQVHQEYVPLMYRQLF